MSTFQKISIGLMVALLVLLVIFAVQNADEATVSFLYWEAQMPLAVLLFITFILGALVAFLVSWINGMKSKNDDIIPIEDEQK